MLRSGAQGWSSIRDGHLKMTLDNTQREAKTTVACGQGWGCQSLRAMHCNNAWRKTVDATNTTNVYCIPHRFFNILYAVMILQLFFKIQWIVVFNNDVFVWFTDVSRLTIGCNCVTLASDWCMHSVTVEMLLLLCLSDFDVAFCTVQRLNVVVTFSLFWVWFGSVWDQ